MNPYSWDGFWLCVSHPLLWLMFYLVPGYALFAVGLEAVFLASRWRRRRRRERGDVW